MINKTNKPNMELPKQFSKISLKARPIFKIAGLAVLGIIVIYVAIIFIGAIFGNISSFQNRGFNQASSLYSDSGYANSKNAPIVAMSKSLSIGNSLGGLSMRNAESIASPAPYDVAGSTGASAENFETTEYRASIETGQLKESCAKITALKSREEVVFENASEYNRGCNYSFKVKRNKANEILDVIKGMNPKELTVNTYTIENQITDFTSEITILQNKLTSIDDTLNKAVAAYDDVSTLATKEKDVENLAKIISNKINTIQQLTQERINISYRLDQIQRSKMQQLDKLDYTYFSVSVIKKSFADWEGIKDSWSAAVRSSIEDINQMFQNISINLFVFLLTLLQYAVYGFIILLVVKYGWKSAKRIWLKK